jgi:hypothetical protein
MVELKEFIVKQIEINNKLKQRTQEEKYFQGMVDGLKEVLEEIEKTNPSI